MAPCWKIDELAQRGKVTVDTIRYYAREKLFPPPVRSGRHKLYGPEHLDRLGWIRKLQAERFSLAAIRAVLDADRPGIEHLFTPGCGPGALGRRPRFRVRRESRRRSTPCAGSG